MSQIAGPDHAIYGWEGWQLMPVRWQRSAVVWIMPVLRCLPRWRRSAVGRACRARCVRQMACRIE